MATQAQGHLYKDPLACRTIYFQAMMVSVHYDILHDNKTTEGTIWIDTKELLIAAAAFATTVVVVVVAFYFVFARIGPNTINPQKLTVLVDVRGVLQLDKTLKSLDGKLLNIKDGIIRLENGLVP